MNPMVFGFQSWLALGVALLCGVLLVRLLLAPGRRARFDHFWRERVAKAQWRRLKGMGSSWRQLRHRRANKVMAERVAADAINKARRKPTKVDKDGNVYSPHAFKGPRKPD